MFYSSHVLVQRQYSSLVVLASYNVTWLHKAGPQAIGTLSACAVDFQPLIHVLPLYVEYPQNQREILWFTASPHDILCSCSFAGTVAASYSYKFVLFLRPPSRSHGK